jgi:sugar transferase (PEP-CTERM system associated)
MKVFGQHVYPQMLLLALIEFSLASFAFLLSTSARLPGRPALGAGAVTFVLPCVICFGLAVIVGITAMGLYQGKQRLGTEGVLARVLMGLGLAAIIVALANLVLQLGITWQAWLATFGLAVLFISVARVVFPKVVSDDVFRRYVLVYGAGRRARSLLKLRRHSDRRGFHLVAFAAVPGDEGPLQDDRVVSIEGGLLDYAQAHGIDEIIIAMDDRRVEFPVRELLDCKFAGIMVLDLENFLEREAGKIMLDLTTPSWLIFSEGFGKRNAWQWVSRFVDLVIAGILLVVTLPIVAAVAVAVLIDDGFPILYRQQRVGLMGRPYTLFKFRTMHRNAEAQGVPQWASRQDSRVTRTGAVLRKLRLDELPQLVNVLRGEMSLVGPRPERPEFVERLSQLIPYYAERHCVKPGITGWAQLCYPYGSSDKDAAEKLEYDLYYIKHRSLVFDLIVLLQTVEVVLWGKGAR